VPEIILMMVSSLPHTQSTSSFFISHNWRHQSQQKASNPTTGLNLICKTITPDSYDELKGGSEISPGIHEWNSSL